MVLSLAPMLILIIAIAGAFFGERAVQSQLVGQLHDLLGNRGAEVIQIVLASAHQSRTGIVATIISVGMLLFSSTSAFAELKDSLDELWGVWGHRGHGLQSSVQHMVGRRLLAFGLVVVLSLFLLLSLTLNAALVAAQEYYGKLWAYAAFALVAQILANIFSFVLVAALFAVIYKLLPKITIPWRHVLPGATITAGLFLLGKWLIGLYLSRGAVASAYGAAGSVVVFLLWIYYSSQIFFFGAVFTRQYAHYLERSASHHAPP
jgi:membrane protein